MTHVVRDKRKLLEILTDPNDARKRLSLARRSTEFDNDTTKVFSAVHGPALRAVESLTLYNCKLDRVRGLSVLAGAPLESLALGNNSITELPSSLAFAKETLQRLWAEDNALSGSLPASLLSCTRLRVLRLSNNKLSDLTGIGALAALEELAVDNNSLETLPDEFGSMTELRVLVLRGNRLRSLPESISACAKLESLYASSNDLKSLPETLGKCTALKILTVNGNASLKSLPESLVDARALSRVIAAACSIDALPLRLVAAWAPKLDPVVVESAAVLTLAADHSAGSSVDAWVDSFSTDAIDLRAALLDSPGSERALFLPFSPAAVSSAPPFINFDGNPLLALALKAKARRAAALKDLQATLVSLGDGDGAVTVAQGARIAVAAAVARVERTIRPR